MGGILDVVCLILLVVLVVAVVAVVSIAWHRYGNCDWGRHDWEDEWSEPESAVHETGYCGMMKQNRFCKKCHAQQIRRYMN